MVTASHTPSQNGSRADGIVESTWCTVTVHGPRGAVDVALPDDATVAETVFELTSGLLPGAPLRGEQGRPWVLHRLGRDPLRAGETLRAAGLHDGDVLHVSAAPAPRPAVAVDDGLVALADGAIGAHRWTPYAVSVLLAVVVVGLSGLAALFALALPGGPALPVVLALLLLGAAFVLRPYGNDVAVLGAALASLPAWAAVGVAAARLATPTTALTLALVGAALVIGSAFAGVVVPTRAPWWACTGALGVSTAVPAALSAGDVMYPQRAVAVVAVVWLALLVALPWAITRRREWMEPEPGGGAEEIAERAVMTRRTVDGIALAGGLVLATIAVLLAPGGDGLTVGFVAAVSVTTLLRARRSLFVVESASAVGAGLIGLAAVGLGLVSSGGPALDASVAGVVIVLLGTVVALSTAVRSDGGLAAWWERPRSRRTLDWLETAVAVATLPLLAGVLGLYTAAADAGSHL